MLNRVLTLAALSVAASTISFAQTASTVPVGFMTFAVSAGTPAAPVTTPIAMPLQDAPAAAGAMSGYITSITSNSLTVTGAGWTASALSDPTTPYMLRLTKGAAAGITFGISANTDSTLTLVGSDLTTLGVVTGAGNDTFEIFPVDTLFTLFGTSTLLGGTSATNADVVYIMSGGAWVGYYFNTTRGFWVRTTGSTAINRNATILAPETGFLVERRGPALSLTITGRVPVCKFSANVLNSGNSLVHTGFPTSSTLGGFAVQTALPGWVTSPSAATADWLYVFSAGAWVSYYHNGTNWLRTTGPAINRDSIAVEAGAPVLLFKRGAAAGFSALTKALPYSL